MKVLVLTLATMLFVPASAYSACTDILEHYGDNLYINISDGGCDELTIDFTDKYIVRNGEKRVDYKSIQSFPFDEECIIESSKEIYWETLSCHVGGRTPLSGTTYKKKAKDYRYFCVAGCNEGIPEILGSNEEAVELSMDSCVASEIWNIDNSEGNYLQLCNKSDNGFIFEANASDTGNGPQCKLVGEARAAEEAFIYLSESLCQITFSSGSRPTEMNINFSEACFVAGCEKGARWKNGTYELF